MMYKEDMRDCTAISIGVAMSLCLVYSIHINYGRMLEHEKLREDRQKIWENKCTELGGVVLDRAKLYCVKKDSLIDIK